MAFKLNNKLRSAIVDSGITVNLTTLNVHDGTIPVSANDSPTGTLLAIFVNLDFNSASNGTAGLIRLLPATAIGMGTASYGRLVDNTGTTNVIQGAAGTSSTNNFILSKEILEYGTSLTLLDCTLIQAEA